MVVLHMAIGIWICVVYGCDNDTQYSVYSQYLMDKETGSHGDRNLDLFGIWMC